MDARGWKISVECVSQPSDVTRQELGVLVTQQFFDFTTFETAGETERADQLLSALLAGSKRVAIEEGLDLARFEAAALEVKEADFQNRWVWQTKWNRSRTHQAVVRCEMTAGYFAAVLSVCTKDGEQVKAVEVVRTVPSEFVFARKLGKLVWRSSGDVEVLDKSGELVARADT